MEYPTPKHAVIVLLEKTAFHLKDIDAETFLSSNKDFSEILDKHALDGCTGLVYFEQADVLDYKNMFLQLLGVCPELQKEAQMEFSKRFPRLRFNLFSTNPDIEILTRQLFNEDICSIYQDISFLGETPSAPLSLIWLKSLDGDPSVNLEKLLEKIKSVPNCIEIIAAIPDLDFRYPFERPKYDFPQSYQFRKGIPVETHGLPMLVSYRHDYAVRVDSVTRFIEDDIVKNAGNGAILSFHFLAEVAYKLGFTKKYGA